MSMTTRSVKKASDGPFLDAALLCDQAIREKDHAYSAIRMVNRITFHDLVVERGTVIPISLTILVSFKAGGVKGQRRLFLYITNPSGSRGLLGGYEFPMALDFIGGDTGAVVRLVGFPLEYEKDGTYWIDVVLEKKRYSRFPLTLKTEKAASKAP